MRILRWIVHIDHARCTACGDCVVACAENAIEIAEGKATLVRDSLCDGFGACVGHCPENAIEIREREADLFDEEAVRERVAARWTRTDAASSFACPSAQVTDLAAALRPAALATDPAPALSHWPIKLSLVPPSAPFLKGADVALVADCVAFASPDFTSRTLPGAPRLVGCPKLDDFDSGLARLTAIVREARVRSLSVVHMELPCCAGYWHMAQRALAGSDRSIPLRRTVVGVRGNVTEDVR